MTALLPQPTALPTDDRGLVLAHRSGVAGAFDELYRRYQGRLIAFLTHRVGDRAIAEDLAQDTLIRAMDSLERFDADRPLWPWLRRIATNVSIDWARARSRSHALHAALASEPVRVVATVDLAERELMADALQQVPERQRHALEKCYVEGWRPVDVAQHFGVGSNAFEQLLHRARRSLRKAYTAQSGERAAGLAVLLAPFSATAQRLRSLFGVASDARSRQAVEAVVAIVMVGAVVALPLSKSPHPKLQDPVNQPAATVTAPAVTPGGSAELPAPEGPADPVDLPGNRDTLDSAGVARPAPIAPDQGDASLQPVPPTVTVPGQAAPISQSSGSVPELEDGVGGCGSEVRQVLCDPLDQISQ